MSGEKTKLELLRDLRLTEESREFWRRAADEEHAAVLDLERQVAELRASLHDATEHAAKGWGLYAEAKRELLRLGTIASGVVCAKTRGGGHNAET